MKTVIIFGVSSKLGTGYQVSQLIKQCHPEWRCIVLVRDADFAKQLSEQGIVTHVGDATDVELVKQICQQNGSDATVISTLGGETGNYTAQRIIIDCAEQVGIKQMILVTSLGCGDTWSTLSLRAKQAFGNAVREKSLAEVWLQTSSLNYVILRPGGLRDGEITNNGECYFAKEVHGFVYRKELAKIIIDKIANQQFDNRAYSVVDPSLAVSY
ncbi:MULTISPECIES: NAD(P)H-binding protein [unclassified Gilliamella]|uniref:NAD(P)H-binding protein n=1 Tax=unclassified Gilliamella TaxID=2685620 RepID=UPI002269BBFB|nr:MULTISPECIES: NAD(P)H-binding protein [unclassified Gilliamella]MCX8582802.1 NAD(P)H-binding protein [Gilliamella sp. B3372]MCX8594111.1 NAD(P)H-binding protein [Gilliamella sp. B3367]